LRAEVIDRSGWKVVATLVEWIRQKVRLSRCWLKILEAPIARGFYPFEGPMGVGCWVVLLRAEMIDRSGLKVVATLVEGIRQKVRLSKCWLKTLAAPIA